MVVRHIVSSILTRIHKFFTLKLYSIGRTDIYLGVKLRKMTLPKGIWFWIMIPSKYPQEAVNNFQIHLKEH